MKVNIIVDNPARDLSGVVLTAYRLCQMKIDVSLTSAHLMLHETLPLLPDLVLGNFLRSVPAKEEFYRQLGYARIRHLILDTEGGVFPNPDKMLETLTKDMAIRSKVSAYCFWGEEMAEHARENNWFQDKQIVITGCPRFDFYHPRWRQAALGIGRHLHWADEDPADNRPIVMLNGNFSFGNPKFCTAEEQLNMEAKYYSVSREKFRVQQETQMAALREMCKITNDLATKFPQVRFVYRPHPFEGGEIYEELLDDRDNIEFNRSGTVDTWIARSSAVIQRGCTTGIEAGMAGVPTLQPEWVPPWEPKPVVDRCSVRCETPAQLEQNLRQILEGSFVIPEEIHAQLKSVIKTVFHKIDGNSFERVAAIVRKKLSKKTIQTKAYQKKKRRKAYAAYYQTRRPYDEPMPSVKLEIRHALYGALTRLLNITPVSPQYWEETLNDYDNSERTFNVEQVRLIAAEVEAVAKKEGWAEREIEFATAEESKEYAFGFKTGRSIIMRSK